MTTWCLQTFRYIVVGLASNLALYVFYLILTTTDIGLGHKVAMSLLYLVGMLQTFVFNKRWTFSHRGDIRNSTLRYFAVYATGYFLNLALLHIFVDKLGWSHEIVQGLAIIGIAMLLFLAQKYWVFPHGRGRRIPNEGLT